MSHPEKTIEIVVSADGQTTVRANGFAGGSCRDATRYLEQALGNVANEQLTPEFYLTQPAQQQNRAEN